jgi:signal transduction histidine kinase
MHDVLAHSLSGLLLQLEGARMLAAGNPADPRIPDAIDRAHHLGRTGLAEARRAIGMLRDDDLPGPDRLEELAAQF